MQSTTYFLTRTYPMGARLSQLNALLKKSLIMEPTMDYILMSTVLRTMSLCSLKLVKKGFNTDHKDEVQ